MQARARARTFNCTECGVPILVPSKSNIINMDSTPYYSQLDSNEYYEKQEALRQYLLELEHQKLNNYSNISTTIFTLLLSVYILCDGVIAIVLKSILSILGLIYSSAWLYKYYTIKSMK